jgi:hypothetical protein
MAVVFHSCHLVFGSIHLGKNSLASPRTGLRSAALDERFASGKKKYQNFFIPICNPQSAIRNPF